MSFLEISAAGHSNTRLIVDPLLMHSIHYTQEPTQALSLPLKSRLFLVILLL